MNKVLLNFVCLFILFSSFTSKANDSLVIRSIYDESLINGASYSNLRYLCKEIGPRLAGSDQAEQAVIWGKKLLHQYQADTVFLQEVKFPYWVRGAKEELYILDNNRKIPLSLAALGGSIATPKKGLKAEVIEVNSFDEIKNLGEQNIKGKIIFMNAIFSSTKIETLQGYEEISRNRSRGASEAARYGAIGYLFRSLNPTIDDYPHTGNMHYAEGVVKIPAAAISTKAGEELSAYLKKTKNPKVYFKQSSETRGEKTSYNVIAEIKGTMFPNEIITIGGHLDSWDLAEGAHDNGTGVVQSMEVLRIVKALNYRPKHTLRIVLFMNEESGVSGGKVYANLAKGNNENHIAAIESDLGGFTPRGFDIRAPKEKVKWINDNWKPLLERDYWLSRFYQGDTGVDTWPLSEAYPDALIVNFRPDSQRYFDIHHSGKDVFEQVSKRELELGAAAITSLFYLIDQQSN